jgi:hypothetical protein
MNDLNARQRRLLLELRRLVDELVSDAPSEEPEDVRTEDQDTPGCTIKTLPEKFQVAAAQTAVEQNPVNAPHLEALAGLGIDGALTNPLSIAVMTSKYWGPAQRKLTVSFLERTSAALRNQILAHMNAWNKTAGISFAYTEGDGNVRITLAQAGYWSYVGTDILHISRNSPTMCLQDFTTNTPESEYRRVVRHETGHTLGFPHEHMRKELVARLDRKKCYDYFLRTQGWDRRMVDAQVLTPLDQKSIFSTAADDTSIMCYQLPGTITKDGKPIRGGDDINRTDYRFAGKIYPKSASRDAPEAELTTDRTESTEEQGDSQDLSNFTVQALDI